MRHANGPIVSGRTSHPSSSRTITSFCPSRLPHDPKRDLPPPPLDTLDGLDTSSGKSPIELSRGTFQICRPRCPKCPGRRGAGLDAERIGTHSATWGRRASKASATTWGNPPVSPASPRDLTLPSLSDVGDPRQSFLSAQGSLRAIGPVAGRCPIGGHYIKRWSSLRITPQIGAS